MKLNIQQTFTPWEKATEVPQEAIPGLFEEKATTPLTIFLTLSLLLLLWSPLGLAAIPTAFIFARLMALDLTTYTLPNIYTLPLLAVGLIHAMRMDQFGQAICTIILLFVLTKALAHSRLAAGLGGGDLKLVAALFAFLPLADAFWAVALGCIFYFPVTFIKPKAMVPFGVPLLVGWAILLRFPHLPNLFF